MTDDLVTWLRAQLDEDERAIQHAEHQAERSVFPHEQMLAEVEAKRRIVKLYGNALAAHRAGSISVRNRTQDEAAVDVLGEAVIALAQPYTGRPGWREEWSAA